MCVLVLERLWDMDVARSLTAEDTEGQQDRSAVSTSDTPCTDHCVLPAHRIARSQTTCTDMYASWQGCSA